MVSEPQKYSAAVFRCRTHWDTAYFYLEERIMETRVAVMSIIVENKDSVEPLNVLLHDSGNYIIGRMGIPYREKNLNIISVVIDAAPDEINSLSGNLGRLPGVRVKVLTA